MHTLMLAGMFFARHKTVAYERLPSQTGVHFIVDCRSILWLRGVLGKFT